ncbi:MAG: hypothetical protein RL264_2121, partial [Bacteroidota bacterium]
TDDLDNMLTFRPEAHRINVNNNYSYDEEGRLVKDSSERISKIVWRVDGKVKEIQRNGGSAKWLKFDYDAMGHRIAKHVFSTNGTTLEKSRYYILDAQGNQISTYDHEVVNNTVQFNLKERNIFGSSRIGSKQDSMNVLNTSPKANYTLILGRKFYEFTNHLGNVLTVFTDLKIPQDTDNNNVVDNYKITLLRTFDYSPFGVELDGRSQKLTPPSPPAQTAVVVYKNSFDTPQATSNPYTGTPTQLDPHLSASGWSRPSGTFTNFVGISGTRAIAFENTSADTNYIYLNLSVASGYVLDATSYSFYHRSSNKGYTNYKLYINGIEIGSGSIFVSSGNSLQHTGTVNVANAVSGLSGNVTVTLKLFGGLKGVLGTFRMDDFVLSGYTSSLENWGPAGYRYGFQNQEEDSETGLVNYKYRMHDPRVGRFFAVDPLAGSYPQLTSYQFSSNSPIYMIELEGLEGKIHVIIQWYTDKGVYKSKFKTYTVQGLEADLIKICWKAKNNGGGKVVELEYYGVGIFGNLLGGLKKVDPNAKPTVEQLNSIFSHYQENVFNIYKNKIKEAKKGNASRVVNWYDEGYYEGGYDGVNSSYEYRGIEGMRRASDELNEIGEFLEKTKIPAVENIGKTLKYEAMFLSTVADISDPTLTYAEKSKFIFARISKELIRIAVDQALDNSGVGQAEKEVITEGLDKILEKIPEKKEE